MIGKKRDVLGRQIALKLEEAIIAGDIDAGTRLDETQLAARYGVSRTPVREALQILLSRSLVTREPYRGTIVNEIGRKKIIDLFEIMGALEALCGKFAAQRMSARAIAELQDLHAQMGSFAADGAHDLYEQANTEFHQIIYLGSRNEELQQLVETLRLKLAPFRRRQLHDAARITRSYLEHTQIVAALEGRDADAAQQALLGHLQNAAAALLDHWQDTTRSKT